MIDIHTHILPSIDDGPETIEESIEICKVAANDGIKKIVATPHSNNGVYEPKSAEIVKAVGVHQVGDVFEGQRRFPLVVRLPDKQRTDVDALANTLIPTESGKLLPLLNLAEVMETEGYSTIKREWGRRLIKDTMQCQGQGYSLFCEGSTNSY